MTDTVISSASKEVVIGFERPFVMIGERINPTGRKLHAEEMKNERALPEIDVGRELAVIFDRTESTSGMSCKVIKDGARKTILEQVARYPVLAEAAEVLEAPTATDETIAGCAGLRIAARVRDADGLESLIDARIFATEGKHHLRETTKTWCIGKNRQTNGFSLARRDVPSQQALRGCAPPVKGRCLDR